MSQNHQLLEAQNDHLGEPETSRTFNPSVVRTQLFLLKKMILFMHLGLCWVFVVAQASCLVVASGGAGGEGSSLATVQGFPVARLLLLQSTFSGH